MAQSLIWSREALEDIDDIADFISRDSPYHAEQVVDRLLGVGDELTAHPKLGRMVPERVDPNVRERFLFSYRVIYELADEAIHILAVIHGKRLLESIDRFKS